MPLEAVLTVAVQAFGWQALFGPRDSQTVAALLPCGGLSAARRGKPLISLCFLAAPSNPHSETGPKTPVGAVPTRPGGASIQVRLFLRPVDLAREIALPRQLGGGQDDIAGAAG